jgi:hypothetical protein
VNWQPPAHEFTRSRAAAWVGRQAARHDLPMAHFEYRERLQMPEAWLPQGRADLGQVPGWQSGRLAESKYQSYRHDLLVGSYHPSHRAKWTAHEQMHGILGFVWRPDASPFFHALAAWQAEILPVALWYFFDETGLQRCRLHQGQGPLFGLYCAACEGAAAEQPAKQPSSSQAEDWNAKGKAFVEQQLDAVERSVAAGRLLPARYATLDLASDGLAYAAAHQERLLSPAFALFIQRFPAACDSIESYAERIRSLCAALLEDKDVQPSFNGAYAIAQDLAWRLLCVWSEAEGEAAESLLGLVDQLATGAEVQTVILAYQELAEDWVLPAPTRVFACGYPLSPGFGLSVAQLSDGLRSSVPKTLERGGQELIAEFIAQDTLQRHHLARRFASFLSTVGAEQLAGLARLEAAIADAPQPDLEAQTLLPMTSKGPWCLGTGHELVRAGIDVMAAFEGAEFEHQNSSLLAVADGQGELQLLELDEETADWLQALAQVNNSDKASSLFDSVKNEATFGNDVDPETLAALLELGVVIPVSYPL